MIVVRYEWRFQRSQMQEVLKMFFAVNVPEKSELLNYRSYKSITGLEETLALEWEFESMAKWEEFQPKFGAANREALRDWPNAIQSKIEVWQVLEPPAKS